MSAHTVQLSAGGCLLTHIKSTHESNMAVNDEQLPVVSPVENYIACSSVQSLECISRDFGKIKVSQVAERVTEFLV